MWAHFAGEQRQAALQNDEPLKEIDKLNFLNKMFIANQKSVQCSLLIILSLAVLALVVAVNIITCIIEGLTGRWCARFYSTAVPVAETLRQLRNCGHASA